jgi:hypothetical protein
MRFGLKVRVVAVKPLDAAMGFEVRLIEHAPDARTTHGPGATLKQGGDQVGETPACSWAVVRGRVMGGHGHHLQPL